VPLHVVNSVATCDDSIYITLAKRMLYFTSQLQYGEEKDIKKIMCHTYLQ